MILYVKNKLVSLGDSSFVLNEQGAQVFEVKGKVFSVTRKKFIRDLNGETLFIVRNKFWHLFTKKALIYDGKTKKKIAKIKERFFSPAVVVTDCADKIEMQSQGLLQGRAIYKNGDKIGTWYINVEGVQDIVRDSYKLEVDDENETAFMVALIVAVDNIRDSRRKD